MAKAKGWDKQFYKTVVAMRPVLIMTNESALVMARNIFESVNWLNDDEDRIYQTLEKIKTQVHLSKLADVFAIHYHQDLYAFIQKSFNSAEMQKVYNIVNSKADYWQPK